MTKSLQSCLKDFQLQGDSPGPKFVLRSLLLLFIFLKKILSTQWHAYPRVAFPNSVRMRPCSRVGSVSPVEKRSVHFGWTGPDKHQMSFQRHQAHPGIIRNLGHHIVRSPSHCAHTAVSPQQTSGYVLRITVLETSSPPPPPTPDIHTPPSEECSTLSEFYLETGICENKCPLPRTEHTLYSILFFQNLRQYLARGPRGWANTAWSGEGRGGE